MPQVHPGNDRPPLAVREVAGVILAGGKSSRYGKNKAFVRFDGVPLIERVAAVLGSVFPRLLIVTNTPEEYAYLKIDMVGDLIRGVGPLGGIYTGLKTITEDAGFFVACDMPYLREPLIRRMIELADDHDVVVPRVEWMMEPLHSLYRKEAVGVVEDIILSGRKQILELFSRVRTRYVEEGILRRFDPELRCFMNVNRPEDLSGIAGVEG